jgi:phosphoribosylformylglycinamidine (FGAM) synthase PurS component
MAKEELEIEIRPDGKVSIKTIGIKGVECIEAARKILAMLHGKEIESTRTSDYYEMETTQTEEHVQSWNRWEE